MQTPVTLQQRQAAKREIVRQVEQGTTVSDARRLCPVPMHRTTVYRLLKRTQREGEQAFSEGRHGHPVKLRGEILAFLLGYCRSHPSAKSAEAQHLLAERFASLHAEGRRVVTILQTRKSRDLTSFSDVGTFVPLSTDTHGQVIREVAPARISLPREDHPDEPRSMPNWNRSASKSGKPMNNATTSSVSKNATAKSSAKFSVH